MHSPTPTKSLSPSTLFVLFLCSTSASLAVGATSAPPSTHPDVFQPCTTLPDFEGSLQRFSKVLSFKTVSDTAAKDHTGDAAGEFAALNAYLEQAYPQVGWLCGGNCVVLTTQLCLCAVALPTRTH